MKMLTCAPNSFLTAAPQPRRLPVPRPCAQPSDAAAPRLPPPYTDVNCYTILCTRRQTEHPLGHRSRKRARKGLFALHQNDDVLG